MNKRKEKISAFLDNDMHRDELMSFSLSAEADDAKVAQRYQMLGDALRGELSDSSFVDVSQAVREALAEENIATENVAFDSSASSHGADELKADRANSKTANTKTGFFDLSGWFKPAAGMAVAATVAVVMVTTLSQQNGDMLPAGSPVAVNDTVPTPMVGQMASRAMPRVVAVTVSADEKSQQINPYINQHLEYATQDALQGRLPYVRAVSYDVQK